MANHRQSLPCLDAYLVFAAAFGLYAVLAAPAIGWLDSAELAGAAASLGIPHSPGHAPTTCFGHFIGLFPVGDLAFRQNLATAVAGALAAVMVRRVLLAALAAIRDKDDNEGTLSATERVAAAVGALLCAAAPAMVLNAGRAEVYALQSALVAGGLAEAIRYLAGQDRRRLVAAGLWFGLALANHHFIALTALLPVAAVVLVRAATRPSLRTAGAVATAGLIGLAAFAYLPVRATTHPEFNWGAPSTLGRFWWTVSAKAFQKSAGGEHVSNAAEDSLQIGEALVSEAWAPIVLFALLGAGLMLRRRETAAGRAVVAAVGGVIALCVGSRVLIGFDPGTPDHLGYLAPALIGLFVLATAGGVLLARDAIGRAKSSERWILVAVLTALVLWRAGTVASASTARSEWAADEWARWELDALPPRTVLVLGYFQTNFRTVALRALEGARPDLAIVDRSFMTYPGAIDEAALRYPFLADVIRAPLAAGAPTPVAALREVAVIRPIWFELHPNLDLDGRRAVSPAGPFAWLGGNLAAAAATPSEADRQRDESSTFASHQTLERRLERLGGPATDAVRDALLWREFVLADYYCSVGQIEAGSSAIARARARAPEDRTLDSLAQSCGNTGSGLP